MTIALGMVCHKGVIVAADTMIAIGTTAQKASKIYLIKGKSGAFTIAFATEDANATRTLINRIERKLLATDFADSVELENLVCSEMTIWRGAYKNAPPAMQLILSSRLEGDGARLYFCEPPNTFLEHHSYVAIGTGASVTDPLNTTLFGLAHEHTEVQAALRRMSYLMYRAKKDDIYCGKSTYCSVVSWNCHEPIIVNHLDIELAERYSSELDFLLFQASTLLLTSTDLTINSNANGVARTMESLGDVRKTAFHDVYGNVISL